jgi:uncharacterized protein YjiS (DUF1127 family)
MIMSTLMSIYEWYKKQRQIRRTMRELEALSNRDLADLGINRCDIEFIAKRSVDLRGSCLKQSMA